MLVMWWSDILAPSGGEQTLPIVGSNGYVDNLPRLRRRGEAHRGELLGAGDAVRFGKHAAARTNFAYQMAAQRRRAGFTQQPRALLAQWRRHLRHACRRRSRPHRIGE